MSECREAVLPGGTQKDGSMLPLLSVAYYYGGFLCGLSLVIWYVVCLARGRRRSPWSFSLGVGWLLIILGLLSFMHSQTTRPKTHIWMDGWAGLQEISFGFWWLALFLYLAVRWRRQATAANQEPRAMQPSEEVWPPPPNDRRDGRMSG